MAAVGCFAIMTHAAEPAPNLLSQTLALPAIQVVTPYSDAKVVINQSLDSSRKKWGIDIVNPVQEIQALLKQRFSGVVASSFIVFPRSNASIQIRLGDFQFIMKELVRNALDEVSMASSPIEIHITSSADGVQITISNAGFIDYVRLRARFVTRPQLGYPSYEWDVPDHELPFIINLTRGKLLGKHYGGKGVGLTYARQTAAEYKGSLRLVPRVSHGASFVDAILTFPIAHAELRRAA